MKSQLLKLEAPYNVIYAGGKVGRHIATLMVWNDDEEALGGIMDAASYPVIDEGEEFPAGTLCEDAELHDCRVLCPPVRPRPHPHHPRRALNSNPPIPSAILAFSSSCCNELIEKRPPLL